MILKQIGSNASATFQQLEAPSHKEVIAVLGVSIFFAISPNSDLIFTDNNSNSSFDYEKFPLDIPVDSVEKILAYFDIHDEPLEILIQLPDPSNFVIQGEPRFLIKNDYLAGR